MKRAVSLFIALPGFWLACSPAGLDSAVASTSSFQGSARLSVVFSTYWGGSGEDTIRDVASDVEGNLYVTGGTASPNFPVTSDAHDRTFNGVHDVFVTKLSQSGKVVWSTFLGGPQYDRAYAIEVDPSGFVYVAGRAGAGFPVTPNALLTEFQGGSESAYGEQDGFVTKLTPQGDVVWATYFGTSDFRAIRDIAVDRNGDVYLASSHSAGAYPAAIGAAFEGRFQSRRRGASDMVVAKLATDGSRLHWATYLGGSDNDGGTPSIRVDDSGAVFVLAGNTRSGDLPTSPTAFDRSQNGDWDLYVAKLSPDGRAMEYGSYLGGSANEFTETHGLAIAPDGRVYVAATTTSRDFPTTQGALQPAYGGSGGPGRGAGSNYPGDIVVSQLSPDGSTLLASTYLGGTQGEGAEGIAVDASGAVWVTGATASDAFSAIDAAALAGRRTGFDVIALRLSADLGRLLNAAVLGGRAGDLGRAAAVSPSGDYFVGGATGSADWPVSNAAAARHAGGFDGLVVRFRLSEP
jgi:hypothetical protein